MVFTKFRKIFCIVSLAVLSFAFISCGGKSDPPEEETASAHSVTGKITYQRLPIKVDDTGYPHGLADTPEVLPLRGISVRAVYSTEETRQDGSKATVWNVASSTSTNSDGEYTLNLPNDDTLPVYVEIRSVFSSGYDIRIIADPKGINSDEPQADRPIYSIRRGLDGSGSDDNPTPAVAKEGKIELDFEIGLSDKWWTGHSSVRHADKAKLEGKDKDIEILEEYPGTGSRIAAIIDTAYKAVESFGNPTPDYSLDLHYRRGITEPLGTYVEYDRERFPLSFEPIGASSGGSLRFFGSVRFDDAFDEGVLLSMMARNYMRSSRHPLRFQFPSRKFPRFDDTRNKLMMTNLHPTMAIAEGLPDAIAAIVLKTPYLTAASGTEVLDIRDITGLPSNIYSAPAITAFTWELALKANEIMSPGNPDAWKEMKNLSINRFYSLQSKYEVINEETGEYRLTDLPSLFTQLLLMSYTQSSAEPINLAEIFTDEVITEMTTSFFGEEIWPRPTEGPLSSFMTNWGGDPNSADSGKTPLPGFVFGMSDAVMDAEGNYSNLTFKENFSARLQMSQDTAYWMSVTTEPPLPLGASIEVRLNGSTLSPYIFNSSSKPQRIVLLGNSDSPFQHTLDFSLKSPMFRVPDTQVTVRLNLVY